MSWRGLWIAGRLLSRLPWPDPGSVAGTSAPDAIPWYPLVGVLIGLPLTLLGVLLALLPAVDATGAGHLTGLTAALILILWVWLTGALHLDGLADTADAWVGGLGDRERTLAIMKDPRSGPAGVTAIVLVLLTKWAALTGLLAAGAVWALPLILALGRTQILALLLLLPPARAQGMGAAAAAGLPRARLYGVIVPIAALTLVALGGSGLLMLLAAAGVLIAARAALLARLGGFTGDTLGALVELSETLLLTVLVLASG